MVIQEVGSRQSASAFPVPEVSALSAPEISAPGIEVSPTKPAARTGVRLLPQIGIIATFAAAYFLVRGGSDGAAADAVRNADLVVDIERALHLYHEPGLQEALASSPAIRTGLNWVYIWGFWPVIVTSLLVLARWHPDVFRRTRNAMILSGGVGLLCYALFPLAPPRLAELGMADTLSLKSPGYRMLQPAAFTNQYAAMPSLHVGWILLMGLAIITVARSAVVRVLGAMMPAAMVVAVVLTANHFIVDALVGAALTTTCWYIFGRRREPGRHRMRSWLGTV